jgi:AraC-like DNA-binding protein
MPRAQARPAPAPESPRLADPLSALLRAVRLRGAVFFLVEAAPPWAAAAPKGQVLAPTIMPGAQHLMEYHVVKRGRCFGGLQGEPPLELHEGDVLVFPHGDAHVLSSSPDTRLRSTAKITEAADLLRGSRPPFPIHAGGSQPASAELVCGFLGCDIRPFNPLIATLPRVLHVRAQPDNAQLNALITLTLAESARGGSGSESMLTRYSELMFVEVVRHYLRSLPPGQEGWLAGLRDPVVGRALALLHGDPARAWTLEGLARAAALSRSALAERFKQFTGQSPMQYLTGWRMQLAAARLAEGKSSVGAVAFEVGYGSEAAFSRAFKKQVGVPPARWRELSGG